MDPSSSASSTASDTGSPTTASTSASPTPPEQTVALDSDQFGTLIIGLALVLVALAYFVTRSAGGHA